jgi:hypothetical protein
MTIKVENTIEGEDITEEIMEEDDEHMFFFSGRMRYSRALPEMET